MAKLVGKDIVELFAGSAVVGENASGVYVVRGRADARPPGDRALFLVCESGIRPIETVISDAKEIIRSGEKPHSSPHTLDLAAQLSTDYTVNYYNLSDGAVNLGFAILVPGGYEVDVPKQDVARVLSQIFGGLTFSKRGWS